MERLGGAPVVRGCVANRRRLAPFVGTASRWGASILMAGLWSGLPVPPVSGQVKVDVGPILAYYRPVGEFEEAVYLLGKSRPQRPADLLAVAYGAEVRVWIGHRIGLQLQGTSASSTIGAVQAPGGNYFAATSARVLSFSLQALYSPTPTSQRYSAWISAGPGLVHHGGTAYDDLECTTDVSMVLGAGGVVALPGSLNVSAGLNAQFYSLRIPVPWPHTRRNDVQRGSRTDLLFHVGISWRVLGGG